MYIVILKNQTVSAACWRVKIWLTPDMINLFKTRVWSSMSFPKCVEILLASYGKLLWSEIEKEELARTVRWYRDTGDCEKVMEEISLKLNYWAKYKVPDFVDTCPNEHLGMIMPDKTTDWTRAVWLIFLEVEREFHLTFTASILGDMEAALSRDSEALAIHAAHGAPIPRMGTVGRRGEHVCLLLQVYRFRPKGRKFIFNLFENLVFSNQIEQQIYYQL